MKLPAPPLEVRVTWLDASISIGENATPFTPRGEVQNLDLKSQLVRTRGLLIDHTGPNLVLAVDDGAPDGDLEARSFQRIPISLVILVEELRPRRTWRGPLGSWTAKGASPTRKRRTKSRSAAP